MKLLMMYFWIWLLPSNDIYCEYESTANDLASIELTLKQNKTFNLAVHPLGEGKYFKLKGKYIEKNGSISLKFNKKINPKLLFPNAQLSDCNNVTILNEKEVCFNRSEEAVCIWGITCVKE
ncbi:MAG: hypothetical protein MRY83_18005 [Flavobacteriales bacterium]|nr:hypothetical protein [Flavobacteriales bacterium]